MINLISEKDKKAHREKYIRLVKAYYEASIAHYLQLAETQEVNYNLVQKLINNTPLFYQYDIKMRSAADGIVFEIVYANIEFEITISENFEEFYCCPSFIQQQKIIKYENNYKLRTVCEQKCYEFIDNFFQNIDKFKQEFNLK